MTPQAFASLLQPYLGQPCVDFVFFGRGNVGSDNQFCIGSDVDGSFVDVYVDESCDPQCGQTVLELFNIMNALPPLDIRWGYYGWLSRDDFEVTASDLSINSEGCLEIRIDDSDTGTLL